MVHSQNDYYECDVAPANGVEPLTCCKISKPFDKKNFPDCFADPPILLTLPTVTPLSTTTNTIPTDDDEFQFNNNNNNRFSGNRRGNNNRNNNRQSNQEDQFNNRDGGREDNVQRDEGAEQDSGSSEKKHKHYGGGHWFGKHHWGHFHHGDYHHGFHHRHRRQAIFQIQRNNVYNVCLNTDILFSSIFFALIDNLYISN